MLRGVVLGLMVVGLAGPMALGQVVNAVDATNGNDYGGFAAGSSFDVAFDFAGLGTLDTWSVGLELGDAVSVAGDGTFNAAWLDGAVFTTATQPIGWASFFAPTVDTTGGVDAFTVQIDIAANADASNSRFGVDAGSGETLFELSLVSVSPSYTGLAAGGALVPEPATMALLLAGVGGGLVARRRRRS